jgi:hypothetical protein
MKLGQVLLFLLLVFVGLFWLINRHLESEAAAFNACRAAGGDRFYCFTGLK